MSNKQSAFRSPWVIAWVSIVSVVLVVNIFMIYLAITGHSGLVVEDYYERGQDYEKNRMKRLAMQPKWDTGIEFENSRPGINLIVPLDEPVNVNFSVTDKAGEAAIPDSVTFYAYRPSDAKQDFSVPMVREAPGRYSAEVQFPLLGYWDIIVSATRGDVEHNTALRIDAAPRTK